MTPKELKLLEKVSPMLTSLGYEVVSLEAILQKNKVLRLFIDHATPSDTFIGIEDCIKVNHLLDPLLDQLPEITELFGDSPYDLEVSSPGIDRPLRQEKDFNQYQGKQARIHLFRPLTADEIENPPYLEKNPRQKNFLGTLQGIQNQKILLELAPTTQVKIPFSLVSKAHLEANIDFQEINQKSKTKEKERKAL